MKITFKTINWSAIFIGVALLGIQLPLLPFTFDFVRDSVVTTGRVVKLNAGGKHPQVEFNTANGQRVTFSGSTFLHDTEIGEYLDVRYVPTDPRGACLDNIFSIWGIFLILNAVAVAFLMGGLFGVPLDRGRVRNDDL